MRTAVQDPRLRARVVRRVELRYAEGPSPDHDRPGHVRAASGLVAAGRGHLVIQDDALFLAALEGGAVSAMHLPSTDGVRQFDEGRGNKAHKPDLEAACGWVDGVVLAFGSGSTARREQVAVVDGSGVRLVPCARLYAALREALPDAELNVEGALRAADGALRLLQRGNGRGGVDAVIDVDGRWVDALLAGAADPMAVVRSVVRWRLGQVDGVPLGFTDGCALTGDRWLYAAAAEASPDAVLDGPVAGSAVGWCDGREARFALVTDEAGGPLAVKLEGISYTPEHGLLGVADPDDPDRAAELLTFVLDGPWPVGQNR